VSEVQINLTFRLPRNLGWVSQCAVFYVPTNTV